jgi:hypothetical protein
MPESNHTCAALGIPYMDTQRNLICAKARESLTFQVTVSENFGLDAARDHPALARAIAKATSPVAGLEAPRTDGGR